MDVATVKTRRRTGPAPKQCPHISLDALANLLGMDAAAFTRRWVCPHPGFHCVRCLKLIQRPEKGGWDVRLVQAFLGENHLPVRLIPMPGMTRIHSKEIIRLGSMGA